MSVAVLYQGVNDVYDVREDKVDASSFKDCSC